MWPIHILLSVVVGIPAGLWLKQFIPGCIELYKSHHAHALWMKQHYSKEDRDAIAYYQYFMLRGGLSIEYGLKLLQPYYDNYQDDAQHTRPSSKDVGNHSIYSHPGDQRSGKAVQ